MKIHYFFFLISGLFFFSCQIDAPENESNTTEVKEDIPKKITKDTIKKISQELDSAKVDSNAKEANKVEKPSLSPPEMKFEQMLYNYGVIVSGEVITHDFKFVNVGDRPLEINNVIGSCGCTAASFNFLPFPKGDTGVIKARFDSKGKIGKQENTLTVKSNHKDGDIVLKITGVVKDSAKIE